MPDPAEITTRVFRALHFPHRRREVVSAEDGTPTNVQPGEILYDIDNNKLYAGLDDNTVVEITGGGTANALVSNTTGIAGAAAILNIVKISQTDYDNLETKDANTLYVIDNGV